MGGGETILTEPLFYIGILVPILSNLSTTLGALDQEHLLRCHVISLEVYQLTLFRPLLDGNPSLRG